jgi:hypothetical protein
MDSVYNALRQKVKKMSSNIDKKEEKLEEKKSVSRYKENPFWEPVSVKVGKKFVNVAGGMHVSDEGESVKHSAIHIVTEVDKEEFVKLYTRNMRVFFDLKPTTQKVLQVVLSAVQQSPNADCIYMHWLSVDEYLKSHELGMSKASFHNAMNELLAKKFIAKSVEPHKFWINPHLFFNGDRMTFIREFRIKTEKEITPKAKRIKEVEVI